MGLAFSGVIRVGPASAAEATNLDERPAPLTVVRSEEANDRLTALALFSAARLKEQKEEPAAALRQYQRALRFGADHATVWPIVVGLAFDLDRHEEAIRYALLAAEQGSVEPALLRQLALYLTQTGDRAGAIRFYERVLAAGPTSPADGLRLQFELGRLHFLEGDSVRAADRLEPVFAALQNESDGQLSADDRRALLDQPALTWRLFAEAFLAANRFDQAEAAFALSQQASPSEGLRAFSAARVARGRGDAAESRKQLEAYLASKSAEAGADPYDLLLQGITDEQAALNELKRLHGNDPENAALRLVLARRGLAAGELAIARELLEKAAAETLTPEAMPSLAELYRLQNDWSALALHLGRVLEASGGLSPVQEQVRWLAADPAQIAALSNAADTLARNQPLARPVRLALALVALEGRQYSLAEKWFNAALDDSNKDQAADLFLGWGVGLLLAEQNAAGAAVLARGVERGFAEPAGSLLRYQLAGALALGEQYDAALHQARRAAALRSQSPEFAVRVPWVLYHAGRHAEAAAEFEKLFNRFDAGQDVSGGREALRIARLTASHAELQRGRVAESEELLEQVLDEFPGDVGAMNDLAYLWADRGQHPQRALALAQAAVAAQPENHAYRDSLGWVLFKLGRSDEAIAELERAADTDPPDGVVLDHLGDAYAQAGRSDDARRTWRLASELLDPKEEDARLTDVRRKLEDAKPAAMP
jgi:tetratricopeptide (TPR) repeat protein